VSPPDPAGYGTGPDEVYREPGAALRRIASLLRRGGRTRSPTERTIEELRRELKLTQHDLAALLKVGQGSVSKLERRGDIRLSTLQRLLRVMGGRLELLARFPDRTVPIALADDRKPRPCRPQRARR
jgi:plasmid maintenance system antidote protein VapI